MSEQKFEGLIREHVHAVVESQRWRHVLESELIEKLLPKSVSGINRMLARSDAKPLGEGFRPCWQLIAFLKQMRDDPLDFPSGKWATIQRIQGILGGPYFGGTA